CRWRNTGSPLGTEQLTDTATPPTQSSSKRRYGGRRRARWPYTFTRSRLSPSRPSQPPSRWIPRPSWRASSESLASQSLPLVLLGTALHQWLLRRRLLTAKSSSGSDFVRRPPTSRGGRSAGGGGCER